MRSVQRRNSRRTLLRLAGRLTLSRAPLPVPPRKLLLLRPDHIGDVLLTAPAVATLRASLPESELTYLVGPWGAEAARHGPPVDRIETLAYPGFERRPKDNLIAPYALLARAAIGLRRERFDMAIVFRPDHWWGALLALAAGIPYRVGTRIPETEPLLTHARTLQPTEHAVEQARGVAQYALEVLGRAVRPAEHAMFTVPNDARAAATALLANGSRRVVALAPLAGAALKSWPLASWAALADRLTELGLDVVLVGGASDVAALEAIHGVAQSCPPLLAGQPLAVSAAIFERCAVVVAPDGGPAHLAGAIGTPTVRLYGPAPVTVFGPWPRGRADQRELVTRKLACVPCGNLENPPCGASRLPACMLALTSDDVLKVIEPILTQG